MICAGEKKNTAFLFASIFFVEAEKGNLDILTDCQKM